MRIVVLASLPLLLLGGLLPACDSGEKALTEVDPLAVPAAPEYEQVRAILKKSCTPCHAGRVSPSLETCDEVSVSIGEVLKVAYEESMPPGAWPRLTEAERQILYNWAVETGGTCP